MKLPSSLARYKHIFATSFGSVNRPRGTFPINFSRFSGVSSMPVNMENRPVPDKRGLTVLTRILWGPYSAASPLVAYSCQLAEFTKSQAQESYIGNSALGCIVPHQSRSRSRGSGGGDVDHRASLALLDQPPHQCFRSKEDAPNVNIEHTFPFLLGDFQSGL
ncbi:hypothetical protein V6Z77_009505 [Aspergillus fumigatus]